MTSAPKAREPNQDITMDYAPDSADLRDILESVARELERQHGTPAYQQAFRKAARIVRSYQRCKLYVPIQTDGTSHQQA